MERKNSSNMAINSAFSEKVWKSWFRFELLLLVLLCLAPIVIKAQQNDAEALNKETDIRIANNKLITTESVTIKINNRNGVPFAFTSILFSKMIKITKLEGYIEDNEGKIIRKLKEEDVIEKSAVDQGSFYDDSFYKQFNLICNSFPYYVHITYQTQKSEFIHIANWFPVISTAIKTKAATLTLTLPEDYKIHYSQRGNIELTMDTLKGEIVYHWKSSYTRIIKPEYYSPSIFELIPQVVISPVKFDFEMKGSFENWQEFGNWESELIKDLQELPEPELIKIAELTKGITDNKEKIRILYHYLQDETRYINVSMETGGLKPYPASYVGYNKYGDCKALSNYFVAVLKAAGIKAYYSNVYSGNDLKPVKMDMPSQQFNHAIVFVPLGKDTMFIDCTSEGPFNSPYIHLQNRELFVVDNNNSHFVKIPPISAESVVEIRKIKVNRENKTTANMENYCSYYGEEFNHLSYISRFLSSTEQDNIIKTSFVEPGNEMISYQIKTAKRDEAFIELYFKSKSGLVFEDYQNETLVKIQPFDIPKMENPDSRKLALKINYPVYKIDTLEILIAEDWQVVKTPANINRICEFGSYEIAINKVGNQVTVIKKYLLNPGNYPIEKYPEFYGFINQVYEIENSNYIHITKTN